MSCHFFPKLNTSLGDWIVYFAVTGSDTTCKVSGCSNNGVCLHSADRQTCVCHEGWTGADCSMDINECVLGNINLF